MSKENNLTDFLTDVADAIREKKGTSEKINPQDFSDEIKAIKTSTSMWTGHVDVEGLKAIGWDDEDIAYFQEHGVNWMEEDDEYHKVSDDNKALYGVLTADNIQEYKDRIVYLPKIDTSKKTNGNGLFQHLSKLVGIPMLDTRNLTTASTIFYQCHVLTTIPPLDFGNVTNIKNAFYNCRSIQYIPKLNLTNVVDLTSGFAVCSNLIKLDFILGEDKNIQSMQYMVSSCYSLKTLPVINIGMSNITGITGDCYNIVTLKLHGLKSNLELRYNRIISKESLLYIINHEVAESSILITVMAEVYARLSTDPDIVEALANHPLVSLASA